jgi:hypothetical protein
MGYGPFLSLLLPSVTGKIRQRLALPGVDCQACKKIHQRCVGGALRMAV